MLLKEMQRTEISCDEYEEVVLNWLTINRTMIAAKTTQRRLTSVKAYAAWAGWDVHLDEYNAPTPLRGTPHPIPEGIEGVKRMIQVAPTEKQRALVALCGLCGLRVAEALCVKPSHFDLQELTLHVYGKGSKERIVPVSGLAWSVLQQPVTRAWVAGDVPVIPLKDRAARQTITSLGLRAGLRRHVASHDLRATFATAVYDKTHDQRLVQELLGHANGNTTEVYIARSNSQLREGVEL